MINSSPIIADLSARISQQQERIAEAMVYAAPEYDQFNLNANNWTVAEFQYYHAYLDGMPNSEVQRLAPAPEDNGLGYLQIPVNTIQALSYSPKLLKEFLLFLDRLIRLEELGRIMGQPDPLVTKKLDRSLDIFQDVLRLNIDKVRDRVQEYLSDPSGKLELDEKKKVKKGKKEERVTVKLSHMDYLWSFLQPTALQCLSQLRMICRQISSYLGAQDELLRRKASDQESLIKSIEDFRKKYLSADIVRSLFRSSDPALEAEFGRCFAEIRVLQRKISGRDWVSRQHADFKHTPKVLVKFLNETHRVFLGILKAKS